MSYNKTLTKKLPQWHSPSPQKISIDDDDDDDDDCDDDDDDDDDDVNDDDDMVFLFLLIWNTTMATDRTGKSVEHYRNNTNKMPTILTTAQKGKQGS
jgi:hypothetical protein